jgi:hypothetical protein
VADNVLLWEVEVRCERLDSVLGCCESCLCLCGPAVGIFFLHFSSFHCVCARTPRTTMTSMLPIDIHYKKMLGWLIDRGKISQGYNKQYAAIRTRLADALKSLPPYETLAAYVKQALNNDTLPVENFHYFHAKRLLELCVQAVDSDPSKTTGKNLFNSYKDPDLAKWDSIVYDYERDNIYLGEAARILNANAEYEIPAIKDMLTQVEKRIGDIDRRQAEYDKSIKDSHASLQRKCAGLKIEGKSYRSELIARSVELRPLLNRIHRDVQLPAVQKALDFLLAFALFQNCGESTSESDSTDSAALRNDRFPHLLKLFDTPVPEDNVVVMGQTAMDETAADEIDWGMLDVASAEPSSANGDAGVEIDWSAMLEVESTPGPDQSEGGGGGEAIDWSSMLEVAEDSTAGDTADSTKEEVLLLSSATRRAVMNELMEVRSFFQHRLYEMADDTNAQSLAKAPSFISMETVEGVTAHFDAIQVIIDAFNRTELQQLLAIHTGGGGFDRILNSLQSEDLHCSKLGKLANKLSNERSELSSKTRSLREKLSKIRESTIDLKTKVESSLSSQYDGRAIKIVGEINTLLK